MLWSKIIVSLLLAAQQPEVNVIIDVPPSDFAKNITLDGRPTFAVPFIALVQHEAKTGFGHLCIGSIVHASFVITAAHCFHEYKKPSQIRVVAGVDGVTFSKDQCDANRYKVKKIHKHRNFRPLYGYDVALLELSVPLKLDGVKLAALIVPKPDDQGKFIHLNDDSYMVGYKEDREELDLVSFTTMDNNMCRLQGLRKVRHTDICARSRHNRACAGESGGPLVTTDFKIFIGLLSYSKKPCQNDVIYVFTRMNVMLKWLREMFYKHAKGKT